MSEEIEKVLTKELADLKCLFHAEKGWIDPRLLQAVTYLIDEALQKRDEEIIKMLENTDVQMSVNGDVSQDEIAMAKFIYKAHIRHIIKKIESAIIPPNSINGILPSETDSATK